MRPRCNERKWHRGGAGVGDNQVICISPPAAATSLYILHWPDAAQAEAVQWPKIFGSLLYGGAGIVEQASKQGGFLVPGQMSVGHASPHVPSLPFPPDTADILNQWNPVSPIGEKYKLDNARNSN